MLVISDRVKESSSTQGSGSITLASTASSFQSFASGVGDGNSTYYCIENGVNWEVGKGTYSSAGNTLSRDFAFDSSNSGSKINLVGNSTVFCTLPADKAIIQNEQNGVLISGGIAFLSGVADPTASDLSDGYVTFWKNTTTSDIKIWVNDGDVLRSPVAASPFLVVTETGSDATYQYYGGIDSAGNWKINRYNSSFDKESATVTNNGAFLDLTSAWADKSTLTYV